MDEPNVQNQVTILNDEGDISKQDRKFTSKKKTYL